MDKFLENLQNIVDREKLLKMEDRLSEMEEWDSLAYITFCVMIDQEYGKRITSKALRSAETVQDLYNLVKK